jgi:hypothetical protein
MTVHLRKSRQSSLMRATVSIRFGTLAGRGSVAAAVAADLKALRDPFLSGAVGEPPLLLPVH